MDYNTFRRLLETADELARVWHGDQMYGNQPYVCHLIAVEYAVMERYGEGAYEERIIAVLHDILEDTEYPIEEMYVTFGPDITLAVEAMTKRKGEDYFDYIARVKGNALARRVKLCDSFCNLKQSFKEGRHKGIIKYTTVLQLLEAD